MADTLLEILSKRKARRIPSSDDSKFRCVPFRNIDKGLNRANWQVEEATEAR